MNNQFYLNKPETIKFGHIVTLELIDSKEYKYNISSSNLSFKSNIPIQIKSQVSNEYSSIEDNLFIILPVVNNKYIEEKSNIENDILYLSNINQCNEDKNNLNNNINNINYNNNELNLQNINSKFKEINKTSCSYKEVVNKLLTKLNVIKNNINETNKIINNALGKDIKFNQNFVLIHYKSEMFVCCKDISYENKLCLVDSYDKDSIFFFWPYNKYEKISDYVYSNQNLLIRKCDINIWANNLFLTYKDSNQVYNKKTEIKNSNNLNNKNNKYNELNSIISDSENEKIIAKNKIDLYVTEDVLQAKTFKLHICSNYNSNLDQYLCYKNTFVLKFNSTNNYLIKLNANIDNKTDNYLINSNININYIESNKNFANNIDNSNIVQDSLINNSICVFSKIHMENFAPNLNLLSFFKPEPIEFFNNNIINDNDSLKNTNNLIKFSNNIEYNKSLRLKNVYTGMYLSFNSIDYRNQNNSNEEIQGINTTKVYGYMCLKKAPDESSIWIIMESCIILDRDKYEINKLNGLSFQNLKSIPREKKYIGKNDIIRLYNVKYRRFISNQDINYKLSLKNYANKIEDKLNIKINNDNNNNNKSYNNIENNYVSNINSKSFISNNSVNNSNNVSNDNKSNIYSFCMTLNKNPYNSDLLKIESINDNLSWEANLIVHFSKSYNYLINKCIKSLSNITELKNELENVLLNKDNNNIENIIFNENKLLNSKKNNSNKKLKFKSSKLVNNFITENENNFSKKELNKKLYKISLIKLNWKKLYICYNNLKNYCVNKYSKRYDYNVSLGEPVCYRQDILKEQGFLKMTFNFFSSIEYVITLDSQLNSILIMYNKKFNSIKSKLKDDNFKINNNNNIDINEQTHYFCKHFLEEINNLNYIIKYSIEEGFEYIKYMCLNNNSCIDYAFENRNIINNYFLKYKQAANCLIYIIKNNQFYMEKIIHEETRKNISNKDNNNIVTIIIKYLYENNKVYDHNILNILSKLMIANNKGITSNQTYIYKCLYESNFINERFNYYKNNKFLITLEPKENEPMFYIKYKNEKNEYEYTTLSKFTSDKELKSNFQKKVMLFLTTQLNLLANMCYDRNYICIFKVKKIFPLDHILVHIANIEIDQGVLDALINILNNCYINVDPHKRRIYPNIIKIVDSNLCITESYIKNITNIPLNYLNLIFCISLYLLYYISYGKIKVNESNLKLIYNLISFELYSEKIEYIANCDLSLSTLEINNNYTTFKEDCYLDYISIKEEVKRLIKTNDPCLIIDNHNNSKIKSTDNSSNLANNDEKEYKQKNESCKKSKFNTNYKSFYNFIGYKFLEQPYMYNLDDLNINNDQYYIGKSYITVVIRYLNNVLINNIALSNINSNFNNLQILYKIPKPIENASIFSISKTNCLLSLISKANFLLLENNLLNNNLSNNNNINNKTNEESTIFNMNKYNPLLKHFFDIIDFVLKLKINSNINTIITKFLDKSSIIISDILEYINKNTNDIIINNCNYKYCCKELIRNSYLNEILEMGEDKIFNLFVANDNNSKSIITYFNQTELKTLTESIVKIIEYTHDFSLNKNLIKLIKKLFSQRNETIDSLKKVSIIIGDKKLNTFNNLVKIVNSLITYSETTELWLKSAFKKKLSNKQLNSTDNKNNLSYIYSKNSSNIINVKNNNKFITTNININKSYKTIEKVNALLNTLLYNYFYENLTTKEFNNLDDLKFVQTTCFSLNFQVTIFSFINEICQIYPDLNNCDIYEESTIPTILEHKYNLDTLLKKLFNLLNCLCFKNIFFQENIQVYIFSLSNYTNIYSLGYIDTLISIIENNNKFCVDNYDSIIKIIKKSCSTNTISNLITKLRNIEFKICFVLEKNLNYNNSLNNIELDNDEYTISKETIIKKYDTINKMDSINNSLAFEEESIAKLTNEQESKIAKNKNSNFDFNIFSKNNLPDIKPLARKNLEEELTNIFKLLKLINIFSTKFNDENFINLMYNIYEKITKNFNKFDFYIPKLDQLSYELKTSLQFIMIYKIKIINQLIVFGNNIYNLNSKFKFIVVKSLFLNNIINNYLNLSVSINKDNYNYNKFKEFNNKNCSNNYKNNFNNKLENKDLTYANNLYKIKVNICEILLNIFNYNEFKDINLIKIILISFTNDLKTFKKLKSMNVYKDVNNYIIKRLNSYSFYYFFKSTFDITILIHKIINNTNNKLIKLCKKYVKNYLKILKMFFLLTLNKGEIYNILKHIDDICVIKDKYNYRFNSTNTRNIIQHINKNITRYKKYFGKFKFKDIENYLSNSNELDPKQSNFDYIMSKLISQVNINKISNNKNSLTNNTEYDIDNSISSYDKINNFKSKSKLKRKNKYLTYEELAKSYNENISNSCPITKLKTNNSNNSTLNKYDNLKHNIINNELNNFEIINQLIINLTQDYIKDLFNFRYLSKYIKEEKLVIAKRIKSEVDYQLLLSHYYKNNSSILYFNNSNSYQFILAILNFIHTYHNNLKYYEDITFYIDMLSIFTEIESEYFKLPRNNSKDYIVMQNTKQKLFDNNNKLDNIKYFCHYYTQNLFLDNGTIENFLNIIVNNNRMITQKYLPIILDFLYIITNYNNTIAQNKIFSHLNTIPNSDKFFNSITVLLNYDVYVILDNSIKRSDNQNIVELNKILSIFKFLKNFTEGHNISTQNFIREQSNNKINFNLIFIIVEYLSMLLLKLSIITDSSFKTIPLDTINLYYERIIHALETLCEFLQGPCEINQQIIIRTKIFEVLDKLLREISFNNKNNINNNSKSSNIKDLSINSTDLNFIEKKLNKDLLCNHNNEFCTKSNKYILIYLNLFK